MGVLTIVAISILIAIAIMTISFRYTIKKVKSEGLERADYIKVEGENEI